MSNSKYYSHLINEENADKFTGLSDKAAKQVGIYVKDKGYEIAWGLVDTEWELESLVLTKGEGEDKKYYAVDPRTGDVHAIKKTSTIVRAYIHPDGTLDDTYLESGKSRGSIAPIDRSFRIEALRQSEAIGTDDKGKTIYMYTNDDNW